MASVTVRTRDELEAAKNAKAQQIVVVGKLADDLKKTRKFAKLGAVGVAAIVAAVGLAPVTAGLSTLSLGAVATVTGVEIIGVITAASLGLSLILAIYKGYDVEYEAGGKVIFKRKEGK
jgi:CBS domain containing-hemolysin-like protein